MQIKVLGTGCANCRRLEEETRQAVANMGLDATVEKVEDIQEILAYGVMATPALVINERVVSTGQVPSPGDLLTLLADAQTAADA